MAIRQDGFTLYSGTQHGDVVPAGAIQLDFLRTKFFGLTGESHLIGETGGKELACECRYRNYATADLLQTALDTLEAKAGKLRGAVEIYSSNLARTLPEATFLGYAMAGQGIKYNGVDGTYFADIILKWQQRKRST